MEDRYCIGDKVKIISGGYITTIKGIVETKTIEENEHGGMIVSTEYRYKFKERSCVYRADEFDFLGIPKDIATRFENEAEKIIIDISLDGNHFDAIKQLTNGRGEKIEI